MLNLRIALPFAFVSGLAACAAEDRDAPVPPPPASNVGQTMAATTDLSRLVTPGHPEGMPWKYLVDSAAAPGQGACAGKQLDAIIDRIRREFPAVSDIDQFRSSGPRGPVMNAGPAVPLGAQSPPPDGVAAFVTGFLDESGFGVTFFRGSRCRGEICEDREYWYFETGTSCQPRWVGHFHAVDRAGGRSGRCVDVDGRALWGWPAAPDARSRCDADWSPQNISGTRKAVSLAPNASCGAKDGVVPVELTITQAADLAKADLIVTGTGISFLDGRSFPGTVERQSFSADVVEPASAGCAPGRTLKIRIDFEQPSSVGPPFFGIIDVVQPDDRACAGAPPACTAYLHFTRAE